MACSGILYQREEKNERLDLEAGVVVERQTPDKQLGEGEGMFE